MHDNKVNIAESKIIAPEGPLNLGPKGQNVWILGSKSTQLTD